jgi:hypothetical protein
MCVLAASYSWMGTEVKPKGFHLKPLRESATECRMSSRSDQDVQYLFHYLNGGMLWDAEY